MFRWALVLLLQFPFIGLIKIQPVDNINIFQWQNSCLNIIESNYKSTDGWMDEPLWLSKVLVHNAENLFMNFFQIKHNNIQPIWLKNSWAFIEEDSYLISMDMVVKKKVFIKNYQSNYFNMIHPLSKKVFFSIRNDDFISELYFNVPLCPKIIQYNPTINICYEKNNIIINTKKKDLIFSSDEAFLTIRDNKIINSYYNNIFQWNIWLNDSILTNKFIYNHPSNDISIFVISQNNQYHLFYCFFNQIDNQMNFQYPINDFTPCKDFTLNQFPSNKAMIAHCLNNHHGLIFLNFSHHWEHIDFCSGFFNTTNIFFNNSFNIPFIESTAVVCNNPSSYDFLLIFNFIVCFVFQFFHHFLNFFYLYKLSSMENNDSSWIYRYLISPVFNYRLYFITKYLFQNNMIYFVLLNVNLCILLYFVTHYQQESFNNTLYITLMVFHIIHCFFQWMNLARYIYNYFVDKPKMYDENFAEHKINLILDENEIIQEYPQDKKIFINLKNIKKLSDLIKLYLYCHEQYLIKKKGDNNDLKMSINNFLDKQPIHHYNINYNNHEDDKENSEILLKLLFEIKNNKKNHNNFYENMNWWSIIFHPIEYIIFDKYINNISNGNNSDPIKSMVLYNEHFIYEIETAWFHLIILINNLVVLSYFIDALKTYYI